MIIKTLQTVIQKEIKEVKKPIAFDGMNLPFNSLTDRDFEILLYQIFKDKIEKNENDILNKFDMVDLMQGVGEKGRDVLLTNKGQNTGVIQCKKHKANITKNQLLKEIIKFLLFSIKDNSLIDDSSKFTYYICVSTGLSGPAKELLRDFNTNVFKETNIESLTNDVIREFKQIEDFNYLKIREELTSKFKTIKFERILPEDIELDLHKNPEILSLFFQIKKVTDNTEIIKAKEEIIENMNQSRDSSDLFDFTSFLESYKKNAVEKLNVINFLGFDIHKHRQKPKEVELPDLYVSPQFTIKKEDKKQNKEVYNSENLTVSDLFENEKSIVILGDPGAGKSLLVKFLIVQLLNKNLDRLGLRKFSNHIPFRIELRKYNEVRENKSIIEYLSELITKEYNTTITEPNLKRLISDNNCLFFFDGLDEIFNVTHKNKTKEAIELFGVNFPQSKCIVTSRFIGYHDISFKSKRFDEYSVQPFDETQIEELVTKFYNSQYINSDKRKKLIDECLKQLTNDVDYELKSNPLILTLILILTSNNIIIPESKLEIYEACTKTLVDSLDTLEKELKFEIPVKNKRIVFAHLAHWQYELMSKNGIVTYEKALKSISDLLIERKEAIDYSESSEKASKFLEYAEKRSIYFDNNFTHKTFLEYYTSDYLYINYLTKASDIHKRKLISLIKKYLSNPFWYIVFELLITRIDKEQADNDLLDEILKKQIDTKSINVFYFLITNIPRITNTSDEIKFEIIKRTIDLCLEGSKLQGILADPFYEENSLLGRLNMLQLSQNTLTIFNAVIKHYEDTILNDKDAIEFYNLIFEISSLNHRTNPESKIKLDNQKRIDELGKKDVFLYCQSKVKKTNNKDEYNIDILKNQISCFGVESIFNNVKFKHRENVLRVCTFDLYLLNCIDNGDYDFLVSIYEFLVKIGVTKEAIMKHCSRTKVFYYRRKDNLEKFIKIYLKSQNPDIDQILISNLRIDNSFRNEYNTIRKEFTHQKMKELDKTFEKK